MFASWFGPSKPGDFWPAFEWRRGDLIYGAFHVRGVYLDKAPRKTAREIVDSGAWIAMDQYNAYFGTDGPVLRYRKPHGGEWSAMRKADEMARGTTELSSRQYDQRRAFAEGLRSSRYGIQDVYAMDAETASHQIMPAAGSAGNRHLRDKQRQYKMFRRTCKLGIGTVASAAPFVAVGAKIHFVLDGIDLKVAALKASLERKEEGAYTAVPITSSELRYVFRNWAVLGDAVRFYVDQTRVAAPWEEDWTRENIRGAGLPRTIRAYKDSWSDYAAARREKYGGRPPPRTLLGPR